MPSAARQQLSADFWRSPVPFNRGRVPSSHSPVQAHPGYSDSYEKESYSKSANSAFKKFPKRQHTPTNKKRRNINRRGSSEDLALVEARVNANESHRTVSVSACSDSECGVSYNTSDNRDLYAADSFQAPEGDVLPPPPSKWLTSVRKSPVNVSSNEASLKLQAFLGNLISATERPA